MIHTSSVVAMSVVVLSAFVAGCAPANETQPPHTFLGVSENETSGEGPVGMINGQTVQVSNVTKVCEVPYADFQSAKDANKIVAEENHEGYVYWAVKEEREVSFENANAWVTVLERFKSKLKRNVD